MKTEEIKITEKEIKERPNDQELGAYVRNKLNEKTNQGLINSILTKTDIKQIHTLQNQKDSICNDFKNISGEEALNLKKKCEK